MVWENVTLQEHNGTFTFAVTLHKNGNITFNYKSIPIAIEKIQDDKHPVKIGLSDAYIIDKTIFCESNPRRLAEAIMLNIEFSLLSLSDARRKTIYEYHRITFSGKDIENNTIIDLKALPTCLNFTDCENCTGRVGVAFAVRGNIASRADQS